jgi:hypothetical protein
MVVFRIRASHPAMLALYRRNQVEWALWRARVGKWPRRIPPQEFLARIRALLASQANQGAQGLPAPHAWSALFSPLDTLMLWLALELQDVGFAPADHAQQFAVLRSEIGAALSKGENQAPIMLMAPIHHPSPYVPSDNAAREFVLFSHDAATLTKMADTSFVVIPIEGTARKLVSLLEQAPVVRRGPRPSGHQA